MDGLFSVLGNAVHGIAAALGPKKQPVQAPAARPTPQARVQAPAPSFLQQAMHLASPVIQGAEDFARPVTSALDLAVKAVQGPQAAGGTVAQIEGKPSVTVKGQKIPSLSTQGRQQLQSVGVSKNTAGKFGGLLGVGEVAANEFAGGEGKEAEAGAKGLDDAVKAVQSSAQQAAEGMAKDHADMLKAAHPATAAKQVLNDVKAQGGLKTDPGIKAEMSSVPLHVRNNTTGLTPDDMAARLSSQGYQFNNGQDLLDAVHAAKNAKLPTGAQFLVKAKDELSKSATPEAQVYRDTAKAAETPINGPVAQQFAKEWGIGKDSLKPEGVTQEQLDKIPTGKTNQGVHPGNSKQAMIDTVNELHAPNPIKNTPHTPSLSADHIDVPGKAPIDTAKPTVSLKPPTTENGLVKTFGSIRTIIGRQGNAGKELVNRMINVRETHAQLGQAFKDAVPTVLKLNPTEMKNFADTVEGKAAPLTTKIGKAVTEWQAVAQRIEGRAADAGMNIGHIEDYFPHMYDQKFFSKTKNYNEAAAHLVNSGQAVDLQDAANKLNAMREPSQGGHRFGNLEKARNADIPGYRTDTGVIKSYLDKSAKRIAEYEQFGRDNEQVDKLHAQMAVEGKDAATSQDAFNHYFNGPKNSATAKAGQVVRGVTNALTLSKSAVSHMVQTGNTAITTGVGNTARGWLGTLSKSDRQWVHDAGINYSAGHDGTIAGKVTAPGFKQMRSINRTVSALAGRAYGDALAKAGKVAELRDKWGVQGDIGTTLTESQRIHMAHAVADTTQYSEDPMDLPMWARTPGGKAIGQYRMSYQYKQGGFLFNQVIKEAGKGNIAPALRALAVVPVGGAAVVEAKHLLGSKTTPSNLYADSEAGGAGNIPTSLYDSTNYLYNGPTAASTIAGDVVPAAGEGVEAAFNAHSAMTGDPEPLEKQALGDIPVVGTKVANSEFPTKPESPADLAYFTAYDNASNSLSGKSKDAFELAYGSTKGADGKYLTPNSNMTPAAYQALLAYPQALAAANKMNQALEAKGQSVDPFFNLNPTQQKAYAAYETMAPNDPNRSNWEATNKSWYQGFVTKQDAYYNALPPEAANKPVNPIAYPTPNAEVNNLENFYSKNSPNWTSTQKSNFLTANPTLVTQFGAETAYDNQVRVARGYAPVKILSNASPEVENFTNAYFAASSADKKTMDSSPLYGQMEAALTQEELSSIDTTAAQARLVGSPDTTTQELKDMRDIVDYGLVQSGSSANPTLSTLGSAAPSPGPAGTPTPTGGTLLGYGGSSSSSGSSSTAKLPAALDAKSPIFSLLKGLQTASDKKFTTKAIKVPHGGKAKTKISKAGKVTMRKSTTAKLPKSPTIKVTKKGAVS
jgi:hypothetical protein